jgi:hypothetical protein
LDHSVVHSLDCKLRKKSLILFFRNI